MAAVLQYRQEDGMIMGGWESNVLALLSAQIPAEDPLHGYLYDLSGTPVDVLRQGSYVAGGVLVAKAVLQLTAMPHPFPADGVTRCQVSVTPFQACTVLADGIPYSLTAEDQTLELTSDVPHTFLLTLAPMAQAMAEPLTVEAQ